MRLRRDRPAARTSWEAYRKRMLDETSRFIEWGLKHPEEIVEIPVKPDGEGGFPPGVGQWFWNVVLAEKAPSAVRKWRDFLLNRPLGFLRRGRRRGQGLW